MIASFRRYYPDQVVRVSMPSHASQHRAPLALIDVHMYFIYGIIISNFCDHVNRNINLTSYKHKSYFLTKINLLSNHLAFPTALTYNYYQ